mmetsp:Transcript_5491/g.23242  ORF Transcript_5491/g.23242 Transcript_5491/m.23242 type:complete len:245 (-) Transcript_5491:192-926(-)
MEDTPPSSCTAEVISRCAVESRTRVPSPLPQTMWSWSPGGPSTKARAVTPLLKRFLDARAKRSDATFISMTSPEAVPAHRNLSVGSRQMQLMERRMVPSMNSAGKIRRRSMSRCHLRRLYWPPDTRRRGSVLSQRSVMTAWEAAGEPQTASPAARSQMTMVLSSSPPSDARKDPSQLKLTSRTMTLWRTSLWMSSPVRSMVFALRTAESKSHTMTGARKPMEVRWPDAMRFPSRLMATHVTRSV